MAVEKDFKKLTELMTSIEGEVNKVVASKNKAAAKRARKGLSEVKKLAQSLRKEIQSEIKG